jgi:CysZ protein
MENTMNSEQTLFKKIKIKNSIPAGFVNTFRSFGLLGSNKGLLPYFAIPFLLNIIILSGVFYFSYTSLVPMAESFLSGTQWYMQFIRFLVSPVLFILISIFTVLIYSIAGGIVTAPFLDLLSSKTEKILGAGNDDEGFSIKQILSDIFRALMNTIRLLILIVLINLVLLLLNIIPGGSFLYAFLNFMSALFFYGFQFYDFPLERRRYSFNEKLKITWKFKWSVLGSGLAFFLISFIPVIGFLGLNLCTIGAALTFVEDIKPSLNRS